MYLRFFVCVLRLTSDWKVLSCEYNTWTIYTKKRSVLPNSKLKMVVVVKQQHKLWLHSIVWVVCFGSFKSSWWAVVHWALWRSSTYRHSVQQCVNTNVPGLIMYVNCMATTSLFKTTLAPKYVVLLHNIVLAILTK